MNISGPNFPDTIVKDPDLYYIGLTGGIAAGKSVVGSMLRDLGALVVVADRFAHEVLEQPGVVAEVRRVFGDGVIDPDTGFIDRRRLGAVVFDDAAKLAALNAIVHPRVRAKTAAAIAEFKAAAPAVPVVVLDVPLLYETPYYAICDAVWFIDAPHDQRTLRVMEHRGWDAHEIDRRESKLAALDEKKTRAGAVIDNSGSIVNTKAQVCAAWERVLQQLKQKSS